jgi:pSer/pThr/pTyr-binding forkhead associated (FHA) protein
MYAWFPNTNGYGINTAGGNLLSRLFTEFIPQWRYFMDETNSPSLEQNVFLIFNRQIIPLDKQVTRLGRQLDNDLVFNEEFVSRFHAEIRLEDGKYVLYDNESTSGTFVNSKKIDRCVLNSGDLISLASIQIMFVNNNARLVDKARGTTQSLPNYGNKDQ